MTWWEDPPHRVSTHPRICDYFIVPMYQRVGRRVLRPGPSRDHRRTRGPAGMFASRIWLHVMLFILRHPQRDDQHPNTILTIIKLSWSAGEVQRNTLTTHKSVSPCPRGDACPTTHFSIRAVSRCAAHTRIT